MPHLRQVLTGLIYAGLIKENSERFVGVATLLDNAQGSTQVFLAPWLGMSHVVSRTSNLISQYLQAPGSSSIFKLIILQHDLLHGGRSKLTSHIIGSSAVSNTPDANATRPVYV
jgi:hypothetical protein